MPKSPREVFWKAKLYTSYNLCNFHTENSTCPFIPLLKCMSNIHAGTCQEWYVYVLSFAEWSSVRTCLHPPLKYSPPPPLPPRGVLPPLLPSHLPTHPLLHPCLHYLRNLASMQTYPMCLRAEFGITTT